MLRWGLIPAWAKDRSIGSRLINARAESAAVKPAFRSAFRHRRCLIVADGFYEWRQDGKRKLPYRFTMRDHRPFAFAGLWESWTDPQGQPETTCTILTTAANELVVDFHDRMPVILNRHDHDQWIDPTITDATAVQFLLAPYPAEDMMTAPANVRVNDVRTDDKECLIPD